MISLGACFGYLIIALDLEQWGIVLGNTLIRWGNGFESRWEPLRRSYVWPLNIRGPKTKFRYERVDIFLLINPIIFCNKETQVQVTLDFSLYSFKYTLFSNQIYFVRECFDIDLFHCYPCRIYFHFSPGWEISLNT